MADVTFREIDEMDSIGDGLARRARAELGVTAWGMQVLTLPPNWDGYPMHEHGPDAYDPNQEEVYIPLEGSATLVADEERFELRPGTMARVGPKQLRQIVPGPDRNPVRRSGRRTGDVSDEHLDGDRCRSSGRGVAWRVMVTDARSSIDYGELLAAARGGDEQAFIRLLEPHRRALHVHCYRLLGSLHDADDALQETALKAWRNIGSFEPRGSFRAWLYRIATNVCLRALERRARQPQTLDPDELAAVSHLQPYPDRLLESEVEERESIGLAFVTVMQLLPPRQRAVLVLRDVLGWSAREVGGSSRRQRRLCQQRAPAGTREARAGAGRRPVGA